MALGTGLCAGKIIAGVLGAGAASVLGFNWITTGCPSGVCPTERAAQAAVVPASLNTTEAAGGVDSCCSLMGDAVEVKTVAADTEVCETKADSCCADEAAVTTVAAETAATSCCSEKGVDQAAVTTVALATEAAETAEACCFDKGAEAPCNESKACCQENFGLANNSAAKP